MLLCFVENPLHHHVLLLMVVRFLCVCGVGVCRQLHRASGQRGQASL
jgi:hypothetical protein